MNEFDKYILSTSNNVCKNLADLNKAWISFQDQTYQKFYSQSKTVQLIKNFLESTLEIIKAVSLKIYSQTHNNVSICDKDTIDALSFTFSKSEFSFIKHFHAFLYALASNYTLVESSISDKIVFVFEFLFKIKEFIKTKYDLQVFENINVLIYSDDSLFEYREKLAEKLENTKSICIQNGDLYYVSKTMPFFVNDKVYYELTVTPASEAFGKFCKFTVFSKDLVPSNYAVRLNFFFSSINILGREMRIRILDSFKVQIRFVELDDLASIVNHPYNTIDLNEYNSLMDYLTTTGDSLLDIIDLNEVDYKNLKTNLLQNTTYPVIFDVLDKCRDLCFKRKSGFVTIRYILLKMRHRIMCNLISDEQNQHLSYCYLKNECLPFENSPFDASLPEHNPHIFDLFLSINKKGRKSELLSRKIKINSESGNLYTPLSSLKSFANIRDLVSVFNANLPQQHFEERKLLIESGNIFINGYVKDTFAVMKYLYRFVNVGLPDYENLVREFFKENSFVDSPEKAEIISKAFLHNKVTAIFGSAGTGKTFLMNKISHIFNDYSKLFLAKTNSSVKYMSENINSDNCMFKTVDSWLHSEDNVFDMLFVDECPTIDNASIRKVLSKISCKMVVLVGDLHQIKSIRFGNWFGLCKYLIPENAVFELRTPYRTENYKLKVLFDKSRSLDENLFDYINEKSFRADFDDSLFYKDEDDEIILCFNYDGLYGINNLNSFLQNSNSYVPEEFDSFHYKYGDPIIFTENNRYNSVLHKNLKGKILGINKTPFNITFKLEVFDNIDKEKAIEMGLQVLECENSNHNIVILSIDKYNENPLKEKTNLNTVPFQLAYALSIYKVQGMEFESVKIVITDESLPYITHNLFYTAITRAKKKLKIFCTEETLQKLISKLEVVDFSKDALNFAKQNDLIIRKIKKGKKS